MHNSKRKPTHVIPGKIRKWKPKKQRDARYNATKYLFERGKIKSFTEIFEYIPKTIVALDFGTNNKRMGKLISRPELFTIEELFYLAKLFEIDPISLALMVLQDAEKSLKMIITKKRS